MKPSEETPLKTMAAEEGKPDEEEGSTFSTTFGLILTCLGCAVGTGNVWRFPRMVATNSGDEGALCFIMVWFCFLFIWSIPMLLIEYSLGRYTRKAAILSFTQLLGPRATWCGMWITAVNFLIGSYYVVILGWCMYYAYHSITHSLPTDYQESYSVFTDYAENAAWPVLTTTISLLLTSLTLVKGVSTIEKANLVLAPGLFILLALIFVWALSRPNAGHGVGFLFTPDWVTLQKPLLWVEAASQNAFDTGAGTGIFIAYAAFMSRKHHIVKFSLLIPIVNNFVSLCCGMMMFATVFSAVKSDQPNATDAEILNVLKESGPGSTGLAFIWLPQLLSSVGTLGRVIAVMFFVCLVFAGVSSSIAMLEMLTHAFSDFGVRRLTAVIISTALFFLLSLGSSLNLDFLTNQDFTWGIALLINGMMLQALVIIYGVNTYRQHIINSVENGDFKAPYAWKCMINYVAPVEAIALLLWWVADSIINDDKLGAKWYSVGPTTLISVLIQWITLLGILILINFAFIHTKPAWFLHATENNQFEKLEEEKDNKNVESPASLSNTEDASAVGQ